MWKERYSGKELKNINIQRKLSGVPSNFADILVIENLFILNFFTALNHKIREIDDIGNRRLQKLNQIDKNAYNAVQWLNNNRNKFKGRVFEPIMLQVCYFYEASFPFQNIATCFFPLYMFHVTWLAKMF